MRCLLVADLHYSLQQYDWVTEVAGDFDVVIIAGDHLDLSSMVDFRAQSVVVRKYIAKLTAKTQLLVCSGNHDLDTRDETGEKVSRWILGARDCGVPRDGDSFVFSDTLFTICPWRDGPTVRGAIEALLAADAKKRPRRWIWVHHAPPASSATSWDGVRHHGDADLRRWILEYRPDFVLCGHVHQSPFRQGGSWADCVGPTWVFNAGHQFVGASGPGRQFGGSTLPTGTRTRSGWVDVLASRLDITSRWMNADAQRLSNLPRKEARVRMQAGISSVWHSAPHEGPPSMEHAAYLRLRAERYFRVARAKSDRRMAENLEALGREFLARAETLQSELASPQPPISRQSDTRTE